MIDVLMIPSPYTLGDAVSGIHTVVRAYARIMPEHGIQFAHPHGAADVLVAHAGMSGKTQCDVAMLHGLYFTNDYNASVNEWKANKYVVSATRGASVITVPSAWVAETIRRDFRVDPIIVPHGVFWEDWQHNEKQIENSVLWAKNRSFDVCDPTPVNDIAQRMPDFVFYTTFASPGAPKNVMAIGLQPPEKMKKWIGRSSMVLSTVKETWGILYAEAMAAGTPVVTANYGHVPNLIEHGVSGYSYNRHNIEDMEYGIRWVAKHRKTLSDNAREQAKQLSWHEAGERLVRVCRLAIERKVDKRKMLHDYKLIRS